MSAFVGGGSKRKTPNHESNLDSLEIHRLSSGEESRYQTLYIGKFGLDEALAQLSLDFQYNRLYFRINDRNWGDWITLSIGDKTTANEIYLIHTTVQRDLLIRFITYALEAFPWMEEKHVNKLNKLLKTLKSKENLVQGGPLLSRVDRSVPIMIGEKQEHILLYKENIPMKLTANQIALYQLLQRSVEDDIHVSELKELEGIRFRVTRDGAWYTMTRFTQKKRPKSAMKIPGKWKGQKKKT